MKMKDGLETECESFVERRIKDIKDSGKLESLSPDQRQTLTPIVKEALKDAYMAGGAMALLQVLMRQFKNEETL